MGQFTSTLLKMWQQVLLITHLGLSFSKDVRFPLIIAIAEAGNKKHRNVGAAYGSVSEYA